MVPCLMGEIRREYRQRLYSDTYKTMLYLALEESIGSPGHFVEHLAMDEEGSRGGEEVIKFLLVLRTGDKYLALRSEWFESDVTNQLGILCDRYLANVERHDDLSMLGSPTIQLILEERSMEQTDKVWTKG